MKTSGCLADVDTRFAKHSVLHAKLLIAKLSRS